MNLNVDDVKWHKGEMARNWSACGSFRLNGLFLCVHVYGLVCNSIEIDAYFSSQIEIPIRLCVGSTNKIHSPSPPPFKRAIQIEPSYAQYLRHHRTCT